MNTEIEEQIDYHLNQPYTTLLERDVQNGKPYYILRSLELEGCMTTGDTVEEAVNDFPDAMRAWLESSIRLGNAIPKPLRSRRYNGKIILRMPPSLHESLMLKAAEQGVSLNQYLVASLAHNLGFEQGADKGVSDREEGHRDKTPSPLYVRDNNEA